MQRSKKIFLACTFVFACGIIYLVIDVSRKTTFPGSKAKESGQSKKSAKTDSTLVKDSTSLK